MQARRTVNFAIFLAVLSISLIPQVSYPAHDDSQINDFLFYYLDLIRSGNYESATRLWKPSVLDRASRLGIRYDGIDVKPDCMSPVIYDYDRLKGFIPLRSYSKAVIDSEVVRLKFQAGVREKENTRFYYLEKSGEYYWLTTPQDYYSRGWPVTESKYFRFYTNPEKTALLNNIGIQSLDNFVETVAEKISIPPERMSVLEINKIDYYLCGGENEVDKLSGIRAKGVYDRGTDAIITMFIPHYYEVALLLVNFKLQKLPMFTLPFIQKGFATSLGGRWQRAPEVVFDFGNYILKYDIIEIDSVLAYNDYDGFAGGDVTHPVGACLAQYIYSTLGNDAFFDTYRVMSGDFQHVTGIPVDEIKVKIASRLGQTWDEFKTAFVEYLNSPQFQRGLIYPGDVKTDRVIIDENGVRISTSEKWVKVEYHGDTDTRPDINVLFGTDAELKDKLSLLFSEQYRGDKDFSGFRYGIKLDKNEIGLYDYATNQIRAKFIDDPGSESDYYDNTLNRVTAYFGRNLTDGVLPEKGDCLILR